MQLATGKTVVVQGLVGNARCGRRPFLAAVHSDYALSRGQLLRRFAESLLPLIGSEDRLASANPAAVGNRCGRRCVGGPSSTAGSGSFPWFILRVAASSNNQPDRPTASLLRRLCVKLQLQCRVVRMNSAYGSTDLPRYWITLGKETIWAYPD